MSEDAFKTLYSRLNKAQKQAVDAIEGPVMVIAGPGTGKTSILTLRIANILKKTDTSPENILALTFTESGAYAMRKKLVSIVGTSAYKVTISTFHGFCNEIIKEYPERFPRIIGSEAITEIDQIGIMEEIITATKLEYLKPYGDNFFYVRPVLTEIRKLKREALGVEDLQKIIKKQEKDFNQIPEKVHTKGAHKGKMKGEFIKLQESIEKNKELQMLYEAYEKKLEEKKFYDFEDMIIEVIKTLKKDGDLLLILQESYHYILADEHQDANNAQNNILELLSNFHKNPNLFIVGDEKQAIFRFQGASLENFLYFKKLYPEALLIHLEENYRSTQSILDASHSLISKNETPRDFERVRLVSKSQKGKEQIQIHEFPNSTAEHFFIAHDIKTKIKEDTSPDEIAVLYRDNKDAFSISHTLAKAGVPFRVESDADIMQDEQIRKLILLFEAVHDLSDDELLGKVLFLDFIGLDVIEIYKALQNAREHKKKLFETFNEYFPDLSKKLSSWASLAHNKQFTHVFEVIVRESGFLKQALEDESSFERLGTLETFFEEVKALSGVKKEYFLNDFILHLNRVREHGILTKTGTSIKKTGVRLMTAHRAKGLEFDFVYIVGTYDGHWGNKSMRTFFHIPLPGMTSTQTTIDDERRLFYVALTRARKVAILTYSREGDNGKEQLPAQFIGEIDPELTKVHVHTETKSIEQQFVVTQKKDNIQIRNKKYLQDLFMERGLSVTDLNNYLKCPWEYFFVNLIRLPKAQNKHQMYGTAVHETLRTFFNKYREDHSMSKSDFLSLFEFNLKRLPFSSHEYEESLKRGKESLGGYFEMFKNTWPKNLITEYSIRGVHLETPIGEILLKGNLDKLELLDGNMVNVVDYKTGKPSSKNKENYHRQIVFYKLLLDLDPKKKYLMKSGELVYIEPDDRGKYKTEKITIENKDVEDLVILIKEKAQEIHSLSFWDSTCDDRDCDYCRLGRLLALGEKGVD